MALPTIRKPTVAPNRAMARDVYPVVADQWAASIGPFTEDLIAAITWMGNQVTDVASFRDQAAASAKAAAQSVSDAAAQVKLATDQAVASKTSADRAAQQLASTETVAAAVRAQINLPSLAGKAGQYWRVAADEKTLELVPLVVNQVGDTITSTQAPDSTWVPTGAVYFQSLYPKLYARLGKLPDWRSDQAVQQQMIPGGTLGSFVVTAQAFGNGKFVISGLNQNQNQYVFITSSDNGSTWNYFVNPLNTYIARLIWTGTQFVGIPQSGSQIVTSPDGSNWTLSPSAVLPSSQSQNWNAVAFGNGVHVATKPDYATFARNTGNPASSAWIAGTFPNGFIANNVIFALGLFVAVNASTTTYYTSPDGLTWTARTLPVAGIQPAQLAAHETLGIILSGNSTYTTADFINWQPVALLTGGAAPLSISAGGGSFLVPANANGQAYVSTDGVKWSIRYFPFVSNFNYAFVFGNNYFISPRYNSSEVYRIRSHSYSTATQFYGTDPATTPAGLNQYIKAA
ncbi:hypothetical protein [uncultured Pseudomonas sp.]|uniref:hypothetical protein n=1 Tax=uncultured Pseudomonas sp. TaxID=114707 RepID=UPI002582FA5C|nr:hypothetical protein [uncultured Pseudomonas sp.]